MTACESLPVASDAPASSSRRAGPMPSARSRSVVGHRQAVTPAPPSSATSSSVRCVAWTAVKRSDSAPASASSAGRRAAVRREALLVLLRLLGDVRVQRPPRRPRRDRARRLRVDGAHAVDRRADARGRPLRDRVHALGPGLRVGVAEALDAAVQVARVEQRDADARLGRRGQHRAAHRVRVVVGRAAGRVVEVVELADAGDAGQRHLGERRRARARSRRRGRACRRARTSARARSRTSPCPRACARAARAGTRASGRWRAPAA